jgi:pimeloyl-ACP methyl ester carboxylesterase
MSDRITKWLSSGILAAGLSSLVLVGAGTAAASPDTSSESQSGEATSTEKSNSTREQSDSTAGVKPTDNTGLESSGTKPTDNTGHESSGTKREANDFGGQLAGAELHETKRAEAANDKVPGSKPQPADSGVPLIGSEPPPESAAETEPPAAEVVSAVEEDTYGSPSEEIQPIVPAERQTAVAPGVDHPLSGGQLEHSTPTLAGSTARGLAPVDEAAPLGEMVAVDEVPETAPAHTEPLMHFEVASLVQSARSTVVETEQAAVVAALDEPRAEAQLVAVTAPAQPTLINVLGTIAFAIFDFVAKIIAGPPSVPANSTVRVARAPLVIDCGDGYSADADWYFPTESTPDKLIYFQHGGFANAGLYNVTAAEFAEFNNAVVVVPSITTNFFACDGCQAGSDQMHAAVASLFVGDRAALLTSAEIAANAAGVEFTGLPRRFVFAGHSGGGQLAAGAAGYYADWASEERVHDLAGVLLLDTAPVGGAIERALPKIPIGIPVYTIAAQPNVLDQYGDTEQVLLDAREGQYVGVRLVGGQHTDAWQMSNPLLQFVVSLATGYPRAENVQAVQVIAAGWITDWFAEPGTPHVGIYPGDENAEGLIEVTTDAGTAYADALPAPVPQLSFIDQILKMLIGSTGSLQFAYCASEPAPPGAATDGSAQQPTLTPRKQTASMIGQRGCSN